MVGGRGVSNLSDPAVVGVIQAGISCPTRLTSQREAGPQVESVTYL